MLNGDGGVGGLTQVRNHACRHQALSDFDSTPQALRMLSRCREVGQRRSLVTGGEAMQGVLGRCPPSLWGKELKPIGWGVLKLNTWL